MGALCTQVVSTHLNIYTARYSELPHTPCIPHIRWCWQDCVVFYYICIQWQLHLYHLTTYIYTGRHNTLMCTIRQIYKHHTQESISSTYNIIYTVMHGPAMKDLGRNNLKVPCLWLWVQRVQWHAALHLVLVWCVVRGTLLWNQLISLLSSDSVAPIAIGQVMWHKVNSSV